MPYPKICKRKSAILTSHSLLNFKMDLIARIYTKLFSKFSETTLKMDCDEFRKRGSEMVEYICQYLETLGDRRVTPSVEPGYLRHLLPGNNPQIIRHFNSNYFNVKLLKETMIIIIFS